ncbi:hypothetical protein SAMN05216251_108319 [Actinacidiphila alni]|uniref:Uncharacterized protein n=1 Tax=Actinacidiphila alni TaxID=380248 RepID=A0A1I2G8X7_9ACTN|nr:hypothetical protein [Actinacidiphila alni]SFF13420.1 hypothetical protein SAMN05216251_108319 [Actinacidiphila alni]
MTTPRPRDWHPLADADPTPGDPEAIRAEVAHMKRLAAMLRAEAADLALIGSADGLKGGYAVKLRDESRELEVHLRETAGRYERVHGHLSGWAAELDDIQSEADRILRGARADASVSASGSASGDTAPDGAEADPLARHRRSLDKVETHRDLRAAHYAARIRHEINDKIKDSWWERRKNEIDGVKGAISLVVDVMSWVATGIALVAIVMTPAGWVAGLAIWLAVGVLAGHLLLAAAGDGSWLDIGMDVFGLLTMGAGTIALKNLTAVRTATKLAAQGAADERAAVSATRSSRSVLDRSSATVNRRGATKAARAKARHDRNIARAAAKRAGRDAAAFEAAAPMAEASQREAVLLGGDRETANLYKDVVRMRAAYPESGAVRRASQGAEVHRNAFRGAWASATSVDLVDKAAGSSDFIPRKPSSSSYGDFKDRYTKEVGTAW